MKKEHRFLIVVDMQKDFIDGSLGTQEAQNIVRPASQAILEARRLGFTVIATRDTHETDYLETREGIHLPVKHCIRGTEGWEIDPQIVSCLGEDAIILDKNTFGSTRLPEVVRENLKEGEEASFILLGLCTDICVVSNAMLLKAAFPESDMGIYVPGCAGVTPEKHAAALETMASCQMDMLDRIA